jgi:VanZ family protein
MLRYYLSPLFWAATILFLSSIPSKELPDFSFWKIFSFDKIVHVAMYCIFSFQVMKSCVRQYANWTLRFNAARVAVIAGTIYGGAIELFQEFVLIDRHGDWVDFSANIAGTFLGVWVFKKIFAQYIH